MGFTMPATTTQMNVRIDTVIKAAGDAALRERGISPTELIRSLWTKVARRDSAGDKVLRLLQDAPTSQDDSVRQQRLELVRSSSQLVEQELRSLGISPAPLAYDPARSDEDVLYEALSDRMRERGTL